MKTPYELLGGEAGLRNLANALYDAMDKLPEAKEIRVMHSDDLSSVKEKLFENLSGWMGGPSLYSQKYGTICLTDPHSHYKINADHRDQWLLCMNHALEQIGASDEVKTMLKEPMFHLADTVKNTAE